MPNPLNAGIDSSPLQLAQMFSVMKFFNDYGREVGLGSCLQIMRCSTSSFFNSPFLNRILNVNIVPTMILCLSNSPLRVYWNAQ